MFELVVNQSVLILAIASSVLLFYRFKQSVKQLPLEWKQTTFVRNFQLSTLFLALYLTIIFIGEAIALTLAMNGTYNGFIITFNYTLHVPFLFGFFLINTQSTWRKGVYIGLYLILVVFYISEGYYSPKAILSGNSAVLTYSIHFIGAFLHLTDLLIKPKSDYFRFQLKINLSILVCSLLSNIISSFYLYHVESELTYPEIIYKIHFYIIISLYVSLSLIFIGELLKLRHTTNRH